MTEVIVEQPQLLLLIIVLGLSHGFNMHRLSQGLARNPSILLVTRALIWSHLLWKCCL